jgi:LemA protein
MKQFLVGVGVVAAIAAIAFGGFIPQRNGLIALDEDVNKAWSDVDTQLQRRNDLIPTLVSTVKGYAAHEKDLLENITAARTAGVNASSIDDKIKADQQLTSALAGLRIQVEAYPDLKANQNFMQLQGELSDIENKLAAVRRFFNSATRELNNAVQTFPGNLVAGMFGFHKEAMYEIEASQRAEVEKAPEIKF